MTTAAEIIRQDRTDNLRTLVASSNTTRKQLLDGIANWFLSFEEDDQYNVELKKPLHLSDGTAIVALALEGAITVPVQASQDEYRDLDTAYGPTALEVDYTALDDTTLRWVAQQLEAEDN